MESIATRMNNCSSFILTTQSNNVIACDLIAADFVRLCNTLCHVGRDLVMIGRVPGRVPHTIVTRPPQI